MKIDIQGAGGDRLVLFVDRDEVRQEIRDRIASRIKYLGQLVMTIGGESWIDTPAVDAKADT